MAKKSCRKSLEVNKWLPPEESSENSRQQKEKATVLPLQDAIYLRKDKTSGSAGSFAKSLSSIEKLFIVYFLIPPCLKQYPYIRSSQSWEPVMTWLQAYASLKNTPLAHQNKTKKNPTMNTKLPPPPIFIFTLIFKYLNLFKSFELLSAPTKGGT